MNDVAKTMAALTLVASSGGTIVLVMTGQGCRIGGGINSESQCPFTLSCLAQVFICFSERQQWSPEQQWHDSDYAPLWLPRKRLHFSPIAKYFQVSLSVPVSLFTLSFLLKAWHLISLSVGTFCMFRHSLDNKTVENNYLCELTLWEKQKV